MRVADMVVAAGARAGAEVVQPRPTEASPTVRTAVVAFVVDAFLRARRRAR
jgi:hypothetical protein